MPPYPDVPNPDLLQRLPLTAATILDVGCGSGALGLAYRQRNPRVRYLGIERDADAARIAATRLDAVATVDMDADPLPFPDRPIDCLVYGDVLEHLADPWRVLKEQAAALAPDGTVLISVPNMEHWSFAARLLGGAWDYEQTGLFDRTHLRWFTQRSMEQALRGAGLVPCDITGRVFDADRHRIFVERITPALRALGIDPDDYARRSLPLQHVWRAVPRARARLTVVAHMLKPEGGVSHVRIIYPMAAIGTDPSITTHVVTDTLPALDKATPKILILHRWAMPGNEGLALLRRLLADGYVIVSELDDHPAFLPAMQTPELYTLTGVHAVQTSTRALAEAFRTQNPTVRVFRNTVPVLPPVVNFADPARMTLFFGGFNRRADWMPLLPALNAALADAGERLSVSIVHDRALFDALETPRKSFTPTCDHATYLDLLGRAEIAFLPLAETDFNRTKSDLKLLEAAACRVAALASPVVYERSIHDGSNGLLFRSPEELRRLLLHLVTHPEEARRIGDAARRWVSNHRMLAYQTAHRIAWYRRLWAQRKELTEALYQRVPALRPAPNPEE